MGCNNKLEIDGMNQCNNSCYGYIFYRMNYLSELSKAIIINKKSIIIKKVKKKKPYDIY